MVSWLRFFGRPSRIARLLNALTTSREFAEMVLAVLVILLLSFRLLRIV